MEQQISWQVVIALVVIVGLIGAIVTPLLKLNTTLVTLDVTMKSLQQSVNDNNCEHKDFYAAMEEHKEFRREIAVQSEQLKEHDGQLTLHEQKIKDLKNKLAG